MLPTVRTIKAGASENIPALANYLHYQESTASTVKLEFRAYTEDGGELANINMIRGGEFRTQKEFSTLRIFNPSGTDISITVLMGKGDYDAPPESVDVSLKPFSDIADFPEKTLTGGSQYFGENLARKSIVIIADQTNVGPVWLASTVGNGAKLMPGGTFEASVTGRVYTVGTSGDKVSGYEVV